MCHRSSILKNDTIITIQYLFFSTTKKHLSFNLRLRLKMWCSFEKYKSIHSCSI